MSAALSVQQLAEIRARVEAAEDGWHLIPDPNEPHRFEIHGDGPTVVAVFDGDSYLVRENAEFAAHARQDVPALLAEVERLRARNADIEVEIRKLVRWHEEDARQIKTWGRRVAKSQQQDAHRRAEALAEAAGLIEAWQHDADDAAALDHGALTDTETAAHIAVHRAATHLRNLAGGETS